MFDQLGSVTKSTLDRVPFSTKPIRPPRVIVDEHNVRGFLLSQHHSLQVLVTRLLGHRRLAPFPKDSESVYRRSRAASCAE